MAGLISSYILEPVARQARRFSGQGQANSAVASENPGSPGPTTTSGERSMSLDRENDSPFENESADDLESATRHLSLSTSSNTVLPDAPTTESPQHEVSPFDTAMENVSPLENVPSYRRSSSTDLRRRVSENARRTTDNSFRGTATASFAQQQRDSQYQHQRSRNPSHSSLFNNQVDTEMGAESPRHRQSSLTGEEMDESQQGNRRDDHVLPEDDGMSVMRRKILEINDLAASAEEKSKKMHQLMMEAYGAHRAQKASSLSQSTTQPDHPIPLQTQAQPIPIEKKVVSTKDWIFSVGKSPPPTVDTFYPPPTAEDLRPTFYPTPRRNTRGSRTNSLDDAEETLPLGCPHYKRNVKMQCSQCQKWYTCRFCHDAAEPHTLERRATKRMLCMLCGTAQPASKTCVKCKEVSAWYYCDICKLWNNDPEKPTYHCDDCGICRQGVRSDFFHCKTCKVCLSLSLSDKHRCIERSMDCDCPICGEYLFTSRRTVVFMRCGHSIHFHCYKEHLQSSYKCPICSRSVMNMEMMFRHLDRAIEAQPMPDEYTDTKALVYCNDCLTKTTVPYHWLGLKCEVCHSYNTAQVQILPSNNSAASPAPPSPPPDAIPHFPQAMPPDLIPRGRRSTADSMRSRPSRQSSISMAIASVDADGQVDAVPTPMLERMYEMDLDAETPDDLDFWGRESHPHVQGQAGYERRDDDDYEDEDDDDEDQDTVDGRSARDSDVDDTEDDLFSIPGHI